MSRSVLVTGGAGFIGSALVRHLIRRSEYDVINVDKLTYAGHPSTVAPVADSPRYTFERVDVANAAEASRLFESYRPAAVFHLAAESHVDRSIDGPAAFIRTNIVGTYTLLEAGRTWLKTLDPADRESFRFVHVSTDEVFGSLGERGYFTEDTPYDPSSPYSASKASADHLVRAWHNTYGFPVIITNCSNNYGPYQFPEKLIPLVIMNALEGRALPIYGRGENVRDWLYVEDHVRALMAVLEKGTPGQTYAIGGRSERRNIDVVRAICALLDEKAADPAVERHETLIEFVEDRPGHDFRYAIDSSKIRRELGFTPDESFESGLEKTVEWYLAHRDWCDLVTRDTYDRRRLGVEAT